MKSKITIVIVIGIILVVGVILIAEYVKKPVCGNGIVEIGETSENCCVDVGCVESYECMENKCVKSSGVGVQAPPDILNFTQLNGAVFQGRIFGDECANWAETLEGYTIIRNSYDDYWTYALKENNTLIPSNYIVTIDNPNKLNLTKHLAPKRRKNCGSVR